MNGLRRYWKRVVYALLVAIGVGGLITGYAYTHTRFLISSILSILMGSALFWADIKGYTHRQDKR